MCWGMTLGWPANNLVRRDADVGLGPLRAVVQASAAAASCGSLCAAAALLARMPMLAQCMRV